MLVAMGRAKKGPEPSKLLRHKNTHLDEGPLWYTLQRSLKVNSKPSSKHCEVKRRLQKLLLLKINLRPWKWIRIQVLLPLFFL